MIQLILEPLKRTCLQGCIFKVDFFLNKFNNIQIKRYCSIFPSINVNGTVRHLQLRPGELKEYQEQCEKVLKRYVKRLQWLLSGSRRLFGTFSHEKIAILIDTSGSMDQYMVELKKELASLIWEQLYKYKVW